MTQTFTVIQKIKMGFGGFFLALIPAAILTAILFTYSINPAIWFIPAFVLGFGFYCGVLMLTPSKLPRNFFLTLTALTLIFSAAVWVF